VETARAAIESVISPTRPISLPVDPAGNRQSCNPCIGPLLRLRVHLSKNQSGVAIPHGSTLPVLRPVDD
jgi:hypothetical protein